GGGQLDGRAEVVDVRAGGAAVDSGRIARDRAGAGIRDGERVGDDRGVQRREYVDARRDAALPPVRDRLPAALQKRLDLSRRERGSLLEQDRGGAGRV